MKQNEWFEATSRIAAQYITEAKPKHLRESGLSVDSKALLAEELAEKPAEAVRQSRITRWVTTGFATAAAVAIVVTGGVLISRVRGKVPAVLNSGTSDVTTVQTETGTSADSFQQGHDAGAEAARAAIAAGKDKVIFSGTVTDKVVGIYEDQLDSDMKYVLLGTDSRIIHVSRALADSLTTGKTYRFTIDEQVIEADPFNIKIDNIRFPFRSAEEVSEEGASDNYTFRRAEMDDQAPAEYISGYQEGYRDVIMNQNPEYDNYRLEGTLTCYIRDIIDPELKPNDPEYADYARCTVVAESPEHSSFFCVAYPYRQKAELVRDQIMTFGYTPKGPDETGDFRYTLKRFEDEVIDPAYFLPMFDTVSTEQVKPVITWNRLQLIPASESAGTTVTEGTSETTETTSVSGQTAETRIWVQGDHPYGWSDWSFFRSGNELHLEQLNETKTNPHSAQLNGSSVLTHFQKSNKIGTPYTNDIPAYDGETQFILKDGQIVSKDGSRILMTGIRPAVTQHFSLYSVEKFSNDCWFVRMTEGWENGGGWVNEYWCDGKGRSVKISIECTPGYTVIPSEDKSCVYYADEWGIFRVNRFASSAEKIVDDTALKQLSINESYLGTENAAIKNGIMYIPFRSSNAANCTGKVVTVNLNGDKTPRVIDIPLSFMVECGGRIYGIKDDHSFVEYLPETGSFREVADIRKAGAAAAKDAKGTAEKEYLNAFAEEGIVWRPVAVWDDLVILEIPVGESVNYAAVSPATGNVQLLFF
ncbi:MAG: hypothetical protein J6Z45_06350 [Oscillospiraceae bacterium]|nr:hypothetical protein [Oscillospiraceae bacterium]